ncbi:peripherin-2-like [Danaus plexippus]|uniref:peripherin-2-like n=1 Tax=Danaus plexippus TaxID=13037 RepID=UPI002AB14AA6|nr:peripherin-2-like [Danaus plexippus]
MSSQTPNRPYIVWASWVLWSISIFFIIWSLLLFFYISDMLVLTGTDLVNAVVLLSGILMVPTNVYIVYSIATGQKIVFAGKVICCRLWTCIVWIIIINLIGVVLCIRRIYVCQLIIHNSLYTSMQNYKTVPKCKHFIDHIQWGLGCCGLNSYTDWFTHEWHDRDRDFEWSSVSESSETITSRREIDSVPYSCCKSGSCVSNYLKELGTYSINTNGCAYSVYRIVLISLNAHLILFVTVVVLEAFLLRILMLEKNEPDDTRDASRGNINNIMNVNDNFEISSGSYQLYEDDSDELETSRQNKSIREN